MELKCSLLNEADIEGLKFKEFSPWEHDPDYLIAANLDELVQAHQFLRTMDKEADSLSSGKLSVEHVAKGECVGLEPIGGLFDEYEEKLRALHPLKAGGGRSERSR